MNHSIQAPAFNSATLSSDLSSSSGTLDPVGYYKGQLYKSVQKVSESRKIAMLDWLTISFRASLPEQEEDKYDVVQLNDNIVLAPQLFGWKRYEHSWNVYYYGELVALLGSHPRKNIGSIDRSFCSLQLKNHVLQTDLLWEFLLELFSLSGIEFNNVQEMHIALDGCNGLINALNQVTFRGNYPEVIRKVGKNSERNVDPVGFNSRLQQAAGFYVGSRRSDKFIRIYDKSRELEKSNKTYFNDLWEANNIDTSVPVERFEMVFRSKEIRKIKDFDFWRLADPKYLASLLRTGCKHLFEFAWVNESDSNTRRWERVEIFDWDEIGGQTLEKLPTELRAGDQFKAKISIHLLVKTIMLYHTDEEKAAHDMQFAYELAERHGLINWVSKKVDHWRIEYRQIGELAGVGYEPLELSF